jgi:hypothetical protein
MLGVLFGLLNNPNFMKQVVTTNATFLNSLTSENFGTSFSFANKSFGSFLNILIQWLLLDYNKNFVNSVFEVLIRAFKNPDFLTSKDPFNIVLFELNAEINLKKNVPDTTPLDTLHLEELNKNVALLMIILEFLTVIPSISNYLRTYFQNAQNMQMFKDYSSSIVCILQELQKLDIHSNQEVRRIIAKLFSDNSSGIKDTIIAFRGVIQNCTGSLIANKASSWWSSR